MGGGGREKGKPPGAKREKGKSRTIDFHPELTRHTHRAHARTTRNDFPVELSPSTSNVALMYSLVEDMPEIYAPPLPRVYAIFLFAIGYSAKAQPTTTGARGGGGLGATPGARAPVVVC